MIKLTYKQLSNYQFQTAMQKIAATPTNNRAASRIRHVIKATQVLIEKMGENFKKDVLENYATKDEKGNVKYDTQGNPEIDTTKAEEFSKDQEEFGKREAFIDREALTSEDLQDTKLSASELLAIGDVFSDDEPVKAQLKQVK